ncbi:hypothetical protein KR044_001035 [Drosophila immigrans]|nr:hypothetical protein KR044_001035 [Drosophila immigrans]
MECGFIYLLLPLLMVIGLTQGSSSSSFSRGESSEDAKTQFNLASTLTGDISSSRHHARAQLNSQLYPDTVQQPIPQSSVGINSVDIDQPSAHENGGSGISSLGVVQLNPAGNHVQQVPSIYPTLPATAPGYPAQAVPAYLPIPGQTVPGYQPIPGQTVPGYQPIPGQAVPGYPPTQGQAVPNYQPLPGQAPPGHPGAIYTGPPLQAYPGYAFQGVYLQQYPAALNYANYGGQQGFPGNIHVPQQAPGAATSYQNQQQYPPRDRFDHSFKMSTEYKEDGVHKGPFEVLNNHNRPGYGSGYGGGYNGAFNRPGY